MAATRRSSPMLLLLLLLPLASLSTAFPHADPWVGKALPRSKSSSVGEAARGRTSTIRHFTLEEAPGRFMRDEVPDDGLQKYVAWCEITGDDKQVRQALRQQLQREHVVWQRECMLPSQKEQLLSETKLAVDDDERPDSERSTARILWEKKLISPGSIYPDGMAVCVAAASHAEFEALINADPFIAQGVFDSVETFEWTRADEPELRYDPMPSPYLLLCKDKPGALETRKATRAKHLDYLRASERVGAAGPITAIGGPHPIGSLVALWGEDDASVEAWAAADPYAQAGVFEEVKQRAYLAVDVTGLYVLQNPSVPTDLFGLEKEVEAAEAAEGGGAEGAAAEDEDEDEDEDEAPKGGNSEGYAGAFLEELEDDEAAADLDMDDDALLGVDDDDENDPSQDSLLGDDGDEIDSLVLDDEELIET